MRDDDPIPHRPTKEEIERVIRAHCYTLIRSKEGRCIDTGAIGDVSIQGIENAAAAIAALTTPECT